eukprot:116333-Pyramimonas_sp.AAC.1
MSIPGYADFTFTADSDADEPVHQQAPPADLRHGVNIPPDKAVPHAHFLQRPDLCRLRCCSSAHALSSFDDHQVTSLFSSEDNPTVSN